MKFFGRFGKFNSDEAARNLYVASVEQARRTGFYTDYGVPDTVQGRFEMIALHSFLILKRLKAGGEKTEDLAQNIFDLMFADMDQNFREMGVGDLGVAKKIKTMLKAFYGRISAYEQGVSGDGDASLEDALRRNVFSGSDVDEAIVSALAGYVRREDAALASQDLDGIMAGEIIFGALPTLKAGKEPS